MKKLLILLIVGGISLLVLIGCGKDKSTEQAKAAVPATSPSTSIAIPQADAISRSTLNRAFPKSADGYTVRVTQQKDGFALAELIKGGKRVATLSISDTAANPAARDKFKASNRQVGGFPAAGVGALGTAVLVANRYQVQVRSSVPAFTAGDRQAWLEKFHLDELATLAKR